jgi:hypothetical protein
MFLVPKTSYIEVATARFGLRAIAVVLAYLLAWHASALFEVRPYVSALYATAGLTLTLHMVLGAQVMPLAFVAIALVPNLGFQGIDWSGLDIPGSLRQVAVYGVAGLYLRRTWNAPRFRLTLETAIRFVVVSMVATIVSAVVTLYLPPFSALPSSELRQVFYSFWGGDFAGVMMVTPFATVACAFATRPFSSGGTSRLRAYIRELMNWRSLFWLAVAGATPLVVGLVESDRHLSVAPFSGVDCRLARRRVAGHASDLHRRCHRDSRDPLGRGRNGGRGGAADAAGGGCLHGFAGRGGPGRQGLRVAPRQF